MAFCTTEYVASIYQLNTACRKRRSHIGYFIGVCAPMADVCSNECLNVVVNNNINKFLFKIFIPFLICSMLLID